MGMWSKLAGYGMMVGGVALMFTPAAAAGPSLMAAGGGVLAADAKKEGVKKAEKQLETASNKAIGTLTQAKNESAQAYKPYTQAAPRPEMTALGNFMGLGPTFGQTGGGPPGGVAPTVVQPTGPLAASGAGGLPAGTQQALGVRAPATPTGTRGVARPPVGAATPQTQAAQANASSYTPTLGGVGGGMVQMRAPTGFTQWVPREAAPFYAQRGAVEVS